MRGQLDYRETSMDLDSGCLAPSPESFAAQLCDLGQAASLSGLQFPHLQLKCCAGSSYRVLSHWPLWVMNSQF